MRGTITELFLNQSDSGHPSIQMITTSTYSTRESHFDALTNLDLELLPVCSVFYSSRTDGKTVNVVKR